MFSGLDFMACSISTGDEKDEDQFLQSVPEIRDVFGDSDDEEQAEYKVQNQIGEDENVSIICVIIASFCSSTLFCLM